MKLAFVLIAYCVVDLVYSQATPSSIVPKNACVQLATCIEKHDALTLSSVGLDRESKSSVDGSPEMSVVGACLESMQTVLDDMKHQMSDRKKFYAKCLLDHSANLTIESLLMDMDSKQQEKCSQGAMVADVALENMTCKPVVQLKKQTASTGTGAGSVDDKNKEAKKKKRDTKKIKEPPLVVVATTPIGTPVEMQCDAKKYLLKQCQKVAKCCPVMEMCRLEYELSDTHRELTRLKLSAMSQRQKCIQMAKQVNLESSKLDQTLVDDIFAAENGVFV